MRVLNGLGGVGLSTVTAGARRLHAHVLPGGEAPTFSGELCPRTRFSLAEILVLAGCAILLAPAVPASTRISARLKRVQEHRSRQGEHMGAGVPPCIAAGAAPC